MGNAASLLWFVSIAACISIAKQRGRSRIEWSFAGLLFVFVALVTPTPVAAETPTPSPTPASALPVRFAATGGARSETFQLAAGRYELLLTIDRSDGRFAADTWRLEFFRLPGDVLLLEGSGSDVPTRGRGELLIADTSWNLYFRIDAGENSNWTVVLRRIGDLPTPDSQPNQAPKPTSTGAPIPYPSAEFTSRGRARSQVFQLDEGYYEVLVAIAGNDRRFAANTWQILVFRIPGDVLLLEGSGRGVSDGWYDQLLIEDDSWNLWFRLDVGDDAGWNVKFRRIGELPTPTPQPARSSQPTATPLPTPTPTPTPQTFQSCQDVPESLIVVDTQGRRAVPRDLVPSAPDGDNDGFACGGQLGSAPTPTPEMTRTPPATRTPRTFQSCQDVPESLIVTDTQGRRAVPRHLVPSAPDGDSDGFACGGQLELAPTPANTQRIQALRSTVSLEFTHTMLPAIQTAAAYAEQRDWRRSGDYMDLAAGSCDLARDAVAEIASLSAESVWDSVVSHLGRVCRGYWNAASALHSGNIDVAVRSLDSATTSLQLATRLVPLF